MATPPPPVIHYFEEIHAGKYLTVKHYDLQKVCNGPAIFPGQINISKNREFAKSSPDYWLKIKDGKTWSKTAVTGLFKTYLPGVYKGDHRKKKDLLIFHFTNTAGRVTVFYFRDYYTRNLQPVLTLLFSKPPETKREAQGPS